MSTSGARAWFRGQPKRCWNLVRLMIACCGIAVVSMRGGALHGRKVDEQRFVRATGRRIVRIFILHTVRHRLAFFQLPNRWILYLRREGRRAWWLNHLNNIDV